MQLTSRKLILILFLCSGLGACSSQSSTLWRVDSLDSIGGFSAGSIGDPEIIDSPYGKAVMFDGDGDRILVDNNPLGDTTEFTIEVIFKPNDAFPNNWEPRFFHIEAPDNPNRRITIELRLNDSNEWYLDTYIKSELSQYTLIDETLVHPVNQWAHAAITYKDRQFSAYVNGKKELSAEVDYLPIAANGQSSIGARMNQVHWFNGAILLVRITPKVLQPSEFLLLDKLEIE
jgi:hypothetical protein